MALGRIAVMAWVLQRREGRKGLAYALLGREGGGRRIKMLTCGDIFFLFVDLIDMLLPICYVSNPCQLGRHVRAKRAWNGYKIVF